MDETPTHLDLFSGIGGFALDAQWAGFRTIGFCEIDPYCRKVLAKNFGAIVANTAQQPEREPQDEADSIGTERDARMVAELRCEGRGRIFPDIFDLDGTQFRGVSLITGGFPCQPFSVAGKRGGAADDRAIWPQMFRVIREARPAWVLGENVPGIIPMELDNVLSDLEGIGYACRSFVIPACAVDARHRRDRVWIIGRRIMADADSNRCTENRKRRSMESMEGTRENERVPAAESNSQIIPHTNGQGSQGRDGAELRERAGERVIGESDSSVADASVPGRRPARGAGEALRESRTVERFTGRSGGEWCEWEPEPNVGRVAHGVSHRVDRLKGLGNAIVPQVAYEILREIRKLI